MNAGNVGIGTDITSPQAMLQVGDNASVITPYYAGGITVEHPYNPGFQAIGLSSMSVSGGYLIGDETNNSLVGMNYTWATSEFSLSNQAAGGYIAFYTNGGQHVIISNSGALGIGTSTPASGALLDVSGHVANSGAAATVGTCGTSPSINGNDTRGTVTVGTGSTTSCTITFGATWGSTPFCVVSWSNGSTVPSIYMSTSPTTTFLLVYFSSSAASKTFSYQCMQ
jgi:hypothetical protein